MGNNGNGKHADSKSTGSGTDRSGAIKPLHYTANRIIVGRPTNATVTMLQHSDPTYRHISVLAYGAEESIRYLHSYVSLDVLRVFGPSQERDVAPWNLDIWLPADCKIDINGSWAQLTVGKMLNEVNVAAYGSGSVQIASMAGGSINITDAAKDATFSVLYAKGNLTLYVAGAALNIYSAHIGFLDAEAEEAIVEKADESTGKPAKVVKGDIKVHGIAESARLTSSTGSIYVLQVDSQPAIYAGLQGNVQVGPKVPPENHVAFGRG